MPLPDPPKLQTISKTIRVNGTHTITPSSNYDGISEATVYVSVPVDSFFRDMGYDPIEEMN